MEGIQSIGSFAGKHPQHPVEIQRYVAGVSKQQQQPVPLQDGGQEPSDQAIENAVQRVSKSLRSYSTDLQISLHEETNRKIVQIKNQLSGETIREFPSKEFVRWEAEFTRWLGVLMDKKV